MGTAPVEPQDDPVASLLRNRFFGIAALVDESSVYGCREGDLVGREHDLHIGSDRRDDRHLLLVLPAVSECRLTVIQRLRSLHQAASDLEESSCIARLITGSSICSKS